MAAQAITQRQLAASQAIARILVFHPKVTTDPMLVRDLRQLADDLAELVIGTTATNPNTDAEDTAAIIARRVAAKLVWETDTTLSTRGDDIRRIAEAITEAGIRAAGAVITTPLITDTIEAHQPLEGVILAAASRAMAERFAAVDELPALEALEDAEA